MKSKQIVERVMKWVFTACGLIAIAFVGLISVYMIISGVPAIKEIGLIKFLFGLVWTPSYSTDPQFGILPLILTTLYGTFGAILIGVPIGLLTAVFLSKVASSRVREVVRPAVELLAGIPSVVYGLLGMMILMPLVADVFNLPKGSGLFACNYSIVDHDSTVYHIGKRNIAQRGAKRI